MNCKNCDTPLPPGKKFCPECGAKVISNRLTLKTIFSDFSSQFLNYDNRFLQTFIHLFTKPALVMSGVSLPMVFIDGTRKKYVNVVQYFIIALTLLGIQLFLMTTFFKDQLDFTNMFGTTNGFDDGMKNFEEFNNGEFFLSSSYQNITYLFFTPIAALATWLSYCILGKRHFNFTEHVVINLYYNAQIIIVTSVLNILFLLCGLNMVAILAVIMLFTYAYLFYVFNRVFYERFLDTLAAMLLTAVFISVIVLALIIIIGIGIIFYMKVIK